MVALQVRVEGPNNTDRVIFKYILRGYDCMTLTYAHR